VRCVDEASRGSNDEGDSSEVVEEERRKEGSEVRQTGWPKEMLPEDGSRWSEVLSGRQLRSSARSRRSGVEIRFPAFGSGNLDGGRMTNQTGTG
jgi:hypothetical protein